MPRPAGDVRHDTAILCLFLYKNKKQAICITHIVQCQLCDILKQKLARKRCLMMDDGAMTGDGTGPVLTAVCVNQPS